MQLLLLLIGRVARPVQSRFHALAIPALRFSTSLSLHSIRLTCPRSQLLNPTPLHPSRYYATGRPHPPGGTYQVDLGEEPKKPPLERYGVDLTERARDGKLDPVIGRDAEVSQ